MFEQTRSAAVRAYDELRAQGHSDPRAFQTALVIFNLHHPEVPADDAKFFVADWISDTLAQ